MNRYGVLRNAAGDAGAWQLLEEAEPGEWVAVARGKRDDLRRLAGQLNGADRGETETAPAANPARAITYDEVLSWTEGEYMEARGRLWLEYRGAGSERRPHYFDGEHGREYSKPAGDLMTGSAHEFTRAKQERPGHV